LNIAIFGPDTTTSIKKLTGMKTSEHVKKLNVYNTQLVVSV